MSPSFIAQIGQMSYAQTTVRILSGDYQLHQNPAYAVGACLHEAGHAVLMHDGGIKNIKFSGPGILRKPDGSLFPYGARVDGDPQTDRMIDAAFIFEENNSYGCWRRSHAEVLMHKRS
jgi:hypothetical protein